MAKRTNGKGLTSAQQSASEKRAVKQTGSAMKLSAAVKEGGKRRAATSPPSNKTVNKKRPRTEPASDARSAIKHLREEEFEFEESGDEIEMDGSFHFDVGDSATKSWDLTSVREMYRKSGASGSSSVQQKIDAVKEDMSDSEEEEEEEEFDEKNETSDNGESDDNNDQQPDTTRTLRETAKPVNRSKVRHQQYDFCSSAQLLYCESAEVFVPFFLCIISNLLPPVSRFLICTYRDPS